MAIKAIAFDYSGVIAGLPSSVFNERMSEMLGIPVETFLEEYYKVNYRLNKEGISSKELLLDLLTILGKDDKRAEVEAFLTPLYANGLEPNADVIELVRQCKAAGYKTAILSNNTLETAAYLHQADFARYFDAILVSMEIGAMKPEPEAFAKLFSALNVLPEETVFIDDSPKSLSTASEVGYHPILFTTYEQLIKDLAALTVKII